MIGLRYSPVPRRTQFLFDFDAINGWEEAGGVVRPVTVDGQVGTFTRAGVSSAVDAVGRVYTAPTGFPAFHHIASTLVGPWLQGAATNLASNPKDFGNAAWVKSNVTVGTNEAVAPDGNTTADTLTATAGNGTVIQDLGVIASAIKSGGLWIKRKTGTGNIDLTLDNGSTWTTKTITSSWTRIQISQTLANPDFGIRLVTSGDAVWVWHGQVEAYPTLTSDIDTTRVADLLEFPLNFLPKDITVYAKMVELGTFQNVGARCFQLGDNDAGTSSTAYAHCATAGDVRVTYHNGSSAVTPDASTGAVAVGDTHEIRAAILAAGAYVTRSINGLTETTAVPASALAHPATFAEAVLSVTPDATFIGNHALTRLRIAYGERTLAQMQAGA